MALYEPVESPDKTTIFPYHDLTPPTTRDIYEARKVVRQYIPNTPLVRSESLSTALDADVYLKREDTLPTSSFKIRGFYNLVADLSEEFCDPGLITPSMGNHGQGLATAAREFGIPAVIVVPETLENPTKINNMERLGATVVAHGRDVDEAREYAEQRAVEDRYRYVHSGNEPHLIAGRASAGLEVMADRPDADILINPVGGGSSTAAYSLTIGKLLGADVIGVQASGADAVHRAWKDGVIEMQENAETFAEGIKTRTPFALPLKIMQKHLSEMVLVEDEDLRTAIQQLLADDSVLAEGAAASGVAAALQLGDELVGKTVIIPISGSNLSTTKLREIVTAYS